MSRRNWASSVTWVALAGFAILALFVRFGGLVPDEIRTPITGIFALAALCAGLGLFAGSADRLWKPILLMDAQTVVRVADRRDSGRIMDTIDDEVICRMGWLEPHVRCWAEATRDITPGGTRFMVIFRRGEQHPIGVITLAPTNDPFMLDIGAWLGPDGRGQGHMRRALKLSTDQLGGAGYSFLAVVSAANTAATKSLTGSGFDQIGAKAHRLPNGVDVDSLIFARYTATPNPADPLADRQAESQEIKADERDSDLPD